MYFLSNNKLNSQRELLKIFNYGTNYSYFNISLMKKSYFQNPLSCKMNCQSYVYVHKTKPQTNAFPKQ
jgi:hypothetical protein